MKHISSYTRITAQQYNTPPRHTRTAKYAPDFAAYEQEKQKWIEAHLDASEDQYRDAMANIAVMCGI